MHLGIQQMPHRCGAVLAGALVSAHRCGAHRHPDNATLCKASVPGQLSALFGANLGSRPSTDGPSHPRMTWLCGVWGQPRIQAIRR